MPFYELYPAVQNYDWGSVDEESYLRRFLRKHHRDLLNEKPVAELWMGAHPKSPSRILSLDTKESVSLLEATRKNPVSITGGHYAAEFPFLFKLLQAEKPLSIQSHPDEVLAKILHEKDPVNYPDPHPKYEIAISLGHFEALAGFRSREDIKNFFETYPVSKFFSWHEETKELISSVFRSLSTSKELRKDIISSFVQFLETQKPDPVRDKWFLNLYQMFGEDPGIFFVYFLEYYHLKKGEAIFITPGTPHAYLKGEILECMNNSDNVIRGGLTKKFLDIDTFFSSIKFNEKLLPILTPEDDGDIQYYTPGYNFFRIKILHQPHREKASTVLRDFPGIVILLEGSMDVTSSENGQLWHFEEGQILFFPAELQKKPPFTLYFSRDALVYLATIGAPE